MTHYTNIKMQISEGQKDKSQVDRLVESFEEKKGMTIRM